jgi:hypothetical protein
MHGKAAVLFAPRRADGTPPGSESGACGQKGNPGTREPPVSLGPNAGARVTGITNTQASTGRRGQKTSRTGRKRGGTQNSVRQLKVPEGSTKAHRPGRTNAQYARRYNARARSRVGTAHHPALILNSSLRCLSLIRLQLFRPVFVPPGAIS